MQLGAFDALQSLRQQISQLFFMEIIILLSWSIWTSRNNLIFKNEAFSVDGAKDFFKKEFGMVIDWAKTKVLYS
jgi:hypothetical protein